jgi:ubiquinone/menaquinone biosynthesis C-methylase UbiE
VKAYYHARAAEYDDWWLGRGRYAGRERPGWDEELAEVVAALRGLPPARTLDIACGTGFLTRHLPGEVTGLDQSEAMLENARVQAPGTTLVVGDALDLPVDDGSFERAFASYFYCHLVEEERVRFLAEVRRVATELIILASTPGAGDPRARWEERVLDDGSRWQVFKRVFDGNELAAELGGGRVLHEGRWFVLVASP